MTIILNQEQARLYDLGFWEARRIEDDLVDQVDRDGIDEPVVVAYPDGRVAFALTPPPAVRRARR